MSNFGHVNLVCLTKLSYTREREKTAVHAGHLLRNPSYSFGTIFFFLYFSSQDERRERESCGVLSHTRSKWTHAHTSMHALLLLYMCVCVHILYNIRAVCMDVYVLYTICMYGLLLSHALSQQEAAKAVHFIAYPTMATHAHPAWHIPINFCFYWPTLNGHTKENSGGLKCVTHYRYTYFCFKRKKLPTYTKQVSQ